MDRTPAVATQMVGKGMDQILPGTGRGTKARSGLVEGAQSRCQLGARAPFTTRLRLAVPLPLPGRIVRHEIFCPVFAQSARKPSMPLSVSGCLTSWRITEGGIVATSAPSFADSST